jgi:FKBP-type peptidyl-prolyl cis-trans isomerase SlpA
MPIETGSRVSLHYRLSLVEDGREVESSFGGEPLELVIGEGELPPALEFLLLGLRPGDHESFEVPATEDVFGDYDEERVQQLERGDFPADIPVKPGTVVGFTTPDGDELPGLIDAVDGDKVTVDFNNPLIGHDVIYEVEILAVEP